ncbi:hypothetical protein WH95_10565 [Kiloniella litopenaei]|uniref:N-acetyltransferase domain-containing protein n=1 Tax=Kiloniella litopenaei TaxID=1549748 RepID=A0A0M2R8S4_9PROT|nr:GNAT family N-acetyltransferase [Kiloniella litopenaei]KKJ76864.1 hypothetical protein WH95_10565 [Kiloniella litopenaei]
MIRKYEIADTAELIKIWFEANKVGHPFLSDEFVTQVAKDMPDIYLPNAETWVWIIDQNPVGFISLLEDKIGALFLDPAFHGKGIGRALVDHAVKLKGALNVEVFEKNAVGRRFYDLYGFVEVDRYYHEPSGEVSLILALAKG